MFDNINCDHIKRLSLNFYLPVRKIAFHGQVSARPTVTKNDLDNAGDQRRQRRVRRVVLQLRVGRVDRVHLEHQLNCHFVSIFNKNIYKTLL